VQLLQEHQSAAGGLGLATGARERFPGGLRAGAALVLDEGGLDHDRKAPRREACALAMMVCPLFKQQLQD